MAGQTVALTGEGALFTFAQVGVALAGFAAIGATFRARDTWSVPQVEGIRLLIETSLAVTIFALFPLPLWYFGWSEDVIWRVAGVGLAAAFVAEGVVQWLRSRSETSRAPFLFGATVLYALPIGGLLELLNALLWSSLGLYLAGLFWLTFIAGLQFLLFIQFYALALLGDLKPPRS